jgi:hypothetical protein
LLRKILGLKKGMVTGKWTRLVNEECHRLYCSSKYNSRGQIKKNGMGVAYDRYCGGERCVQGYGCEKWVKETSRKT